MSVVKEKYGNLKDGREVSLFTITNNNGIKAVITDFGATLVKLFVPNKDGVVKDVVLGFEVLDQYVSNGNFIGAIVGPNANRIANSKFTIDGKEYSLANNDSGNNLHSDFDEGFHKRLWDAEIIDNAVAFTVKSPDMELGFPGNKELTVTYCLGDDNALSITYDGISDKKTIFNPTNHSYFALGGHDEDSECFYDTVLTINASNYTPVVKGAIPTGEIAPVKGTPMDFTQPKRIGEEIDSDFEQLKLVNGYDHNYALDNYDGSVRKVAEASCDGRTMEVYTDLPGMQFYSGNCCDNQPGKEGKSISSRTSFCLETQYFPDSVNQKNFVSPVIDAGERFYSVTIYKFV